MSKKGVGRCIDVKGEKSDRSYEMITFTDSSKKAYAAAVYLKISKEHSPVVNLVFAKNRIAPVIEISIPGLELLGVLIGCSASKFVSDHLDIPDIKQTIFTDSKCVIEWYKSKKELKRFVADKIKEIRSYNINIGYVKSEENPADIASREITVKHLHDSEI